MGFAHLAGQGSPFNADTVFAFGYIKLFAQPGSQAENVNEFYRAGALAGADQGIMILARLEAYSAYWLILGGDGY